MTPRLIIYCDFDGTVAKPDVTNLLLAELADPAWRAIEEEWERGRIGSRECLARQIPLIRGGWPVIEATLSRVELAPTFAAFAAWCREAALPLVIVSDGLDRVIEWLLARECIHVDAVWANRLAVDPEGAASVTFPHAPRGGDCRSGLCKCQVLSPAAVKRVVVGDGLSDLCWASKADYCFAKGRLLASCRAQGVACVPFEDFANIQALLPGLAEGRTAAAPMAKR